MRINCILHHSLRINELVTANPHFPALLTHFWWTYNMRMWRSSHISSTSLVRLPSLEKWILPKTLFLYSVPGCNFIFLIEFKISKALHKGHGGKKVAAPALRLQSREVLSNRTFCEDGKVCLLCPHRVVTNGYWTPEIRLARPRNYMFNFNFNWTVTCRWWLQHRPVRQKT